MPGSDYHSQLSLQLPNLHDYYWMGVTTASSHLPILLCKVWVAKTAKNSAAKAIGDTANRLLPSKKLLLWKRCKVEQIPTNVNCLLPCVQVHVSQGQGGGSGKIIILGTGFTKFRSSKEVAQLWQRKSVTRRVKPWIGGRNFCREGVSGGWECERQVEHGEMVEPVLRDAQPRATAAPPEMSLQKCTVTETH